VSAGSADNAVLRGSVFAIDGLRTPRSTKEVDTSWPVQGWIFNRGRRGVRGRSTTSRAETEALGNIHVGGLFRLLTPHPNLPITAISTPATLDNKAGMRVHWLDGASKAGGRHVGECYQWTATRYSPDRPRNRPPVRRAYYPGTSANCRRWIRAVPLRGKAHRAFGLTLCHAGLRRPL